MAFKQSKNPFGRSPLNFNSPLNSFDSLVGKLMNEGKSKEAATKIAGKVANAKMKGAGSGPTAAQKARAKGSPAKQAKPDFLDLDKDGNTSEPMKEAAKGSPAKMHDADKVKKLKSEIDILRNDPEKAVKMGLSTEGQGGVDYEAISQREAQVKAEQAKHDRKKGDKESPAKMKSPIEKELVGKQKNLPEGLKKAIEAAPESPAKMKDEKTGESHAEMTPKRRNAHEQVKHVTKRKSVPKRKPSRPEASKKVADQLNAKDPIKGSPANLKELGKGKKGPKMPNKGEGQKGPKMPNKGGGKKMEKKGLKKLGRAAAGAALAGAAAGGIKKKNSPLNNAYENPEFFTPTKSSYGQDMDNFFGTVNQAYDQTQTDENRLERADRIKSKLEDKKKDLGADFSDRQQKRLDKFSDEKDRLEGKIGRTGFNIDNLSNEQISSLKNKLLGIK